MESFQCYSDLDVSLWCVLTILFVPHAEDDLRGSVVSSHHIRGHHEAGACGPGQTKVQDLQGAVWLHHYIAWFQVLEVRRDWREELVSLDHCYINYAACKCALMMRENTF